MRGKHLTRRGKGLVLQRAAADGALEPVRPHQHRRTGLTRYGALGRNNEHANTVAAGSAVRLIH